MMNPALDAELEATITQTAFYMRALRAHGLPVRHDVWADAIRENVEAAVATFRDAA